MCVHTLFATPICRLFAKYFMVGNASQLRSYDPLYTFDCLLYRIDSENHLHQIQNTIAANETSFPNED